MANVNLLDKLETDQVHSLRINWNSIVVPALLKMTLMNIINEVSVI